jgi:hypothetical protein
MTRAACDGDGKAFSREGGGDGGAQPVPGPDDEANAFPLSFGHAASSVRPVSGATATMSTPLGARADAGL